MNRSLLACVLMTLVGLCHAGQKPDVFEEMNETKEYREGYKKSAAEADEQIKKGAVTFYTYGLRISLEELDKETRLPRQPIAGCVISDEITGWCAGHNETVREHIKKNGFPPNSFKPWSKDLFELEEFFERESKTVPPTPLKVGGELLKSPDARFTIKPVQAKFERDDGSIGHHLAIILGDETLNKEPLTVLWDEGDTDLFWGPKGSRFVVIRCKRIKDEDFGIMYMALDLQRGRWLRWERGKKKSTID